MNIKKEAMVDVEPSDIIEYIRLNKHSIKIVCKDGSEYWYYPSISIAGTRYVKVKK